MRWFWLTVLAGVSAYLATSQVTEDVRDALEAHNLARAERAIQTDRAKNGVTPELLDAISWLARAELEDKQYSEADRYAEETRKLAVEALAKRKMDDERRLPLALGAAIEVHAQVLAARGERTAAVAFLRQQLAAYRTTSIAARIQKNINLLRLEGKPAPPLDETQWLGPQPPTLGELKGRPVLLFFWAHWCGDCKAEAPVLARLAADYKSTGLVLIGPSQHYGFIAGGDDAPRDLETRYIDMVRQQYYAPLAAMSVPLSEQNFINYGASTTPTLVLIDRQGIVRLYHPGAMPYAQLAAKLSEITRN
ncbi:MAG TPA: TlpA disulfide reductase family protein [Bryobacteraceae bacterium]|nr:TlpA disulfide reductase family protein [Bryobacteraceae bacterium]